MDRPQDGSSNRYANLFYARLKEIYSYQSIVDFDLDELISQVRYFEQSSIHDNTLIILFDLRNYRPLYISKNLPKIWTSFDREELMENGFFSTFNVNIPENERYHLIALEWFKKSIQDVSIPIYKSSTKIYQCGLNIIIEGKLNKFLSRHEVLVFDQKNQPVITMMFVNNINHLFKADFFWGRYTFGERDESTVFYTTADTNKLEYSDIISSREKEILKLIANNKDSRQIAKELYISVNTVEKHRKNMIARSGAKDSTALVQLCKMCGVIL